MGLDRIIVFFGKETDASSTETYQLLIGTEYYGATFDGADDRNAFCTQTSRDFVELINEHPSQIAQIEAHNGLLINQSTDKCEQVRKIEHSAANQFYHSLKAALSKTSPSCMQN